MPRALAGRWESSLTEAPEQRGRPRSAAVLMLIYPKDGVPHTVFTQRTETVAAHRGQISLPGGSRDPEDASLEATALRETWEELGIEVDPAHVWGRLDDVYVYVSNFMIAPYVAAISHTPSFVVNPYEVAHVIEVPIPTLRDPSILKEDNWMLRGALRRVQFYACGPHQIWGATARVIELFLTSQYLDHATAWMGLTAAVEGKRP